MYLCIVAAIVIVAVEQFFFHSVSYTLLLAHRNEEYSLLNAHIHEWVRVSLSVSECVSPASWWSVAPRSGCVYISVDSIVFFLSLSLFRSLVCSLIRSTVHFEQFLSLSLFSHLRSVVYTFYTRTTFLFILLWPLRSIPIWCVRACVFSKSICLCACMNSLTVRTNTHAYGPRTHSGKDKHTCNEQIKSTTTITFEESTETNAHTATNQAYMHTCVRVCAYLKTQSRAHSLAICCVSVLSLTLHQCVCVCLNVRYVHLAAAFQ